MNAPSAASRAMIDRLIGFNTVSRDSNLGLIEWVRDYLQGFGATTRLTHDATGKKANLFATLGDSKKPGLILSGHTDVVPVDGQSWDTDPFVAVERDGRLYARGSADMKGFIGIILTQAPKFVAALNANRLDAPLHYALSYDEEVGCLGVRGLIRDLGSEALDVIGLVGLIGGISSPERQSPRGRSQTRVLEAELQTDRKEHVIEPTCQQLMSSPW